MGAGASATAELTDEERSKIAELKAMSPEAQQELAVAAMREVLAASVAFAVSEGTKENTWSAEANPSCAIPVPLSGDFEEVTKLVGKIPVVGSSLSSAIRKPIENIAASFADCARTVCANEATAAALIEVCNGLTTDKAIQLGTLGGSAYAEYLVETAQIPMIAALSPVVSKVLESHPLTNAWTSCIQGYNAAVKKLPSSATEPLGISEISLDLSEYVVEQTLATLGMIIASKEKKVRGGEVEGMSDTVVKVFGGGQVAPEDLVKAVVLVKAGDPRALYFEGEPPPEVKTEAELTGGADGSAACPATQMITKGGSVLCIKWASSRSISKSSAWMQLGLTARGQETTEGIGRPLEFTRYGRFLASRIKPVLEGEGAVKVLDVANWRIQDGALLGMCSGIDGKAKTFKRRGGRDFIFNEDGSISPAKKAGKLVLGVRLVDNGKTVTLGASKDKLMVES